MTTETRTKPFDFYCPEYRKNDWVVRASPFGRDGWQISKSNLRTGEYETHRRKTKLQAIRLFRALQISCGK